MAFWTRDELDALAKAATLEAVADIAIEHLRKLVAIGLPVIQICGPMTTGGSKRLDGSWDFDANMRRFRFAIEMAAAELGHTVFDQVPLQTAIIRITDHHESKEYRMDILEILYARIFECGCVDTVYMLIGWEESIGATWEYHKVQKHNIDVQHAPLAWQMRQAA